MVPTNPVNATNNKNCYQKTRPASIGRKNSNLKRRWKKPKDMPKRPLSAYNAFFHSERQRMLHPDVVIPNDTDNDACSDGLLGLAGLAKYISSRWKALPPHAKAFYEAESRKDHDRYQKEMAEWRRTKAVQQSQQQNPVALESLKWPPDSSQQRQSALDSEANLSYGVNIGTMSNSGCLAVLQSKGQDNMFQDDTTRFQDKAQGSHKVYLTTRCLAAAATVLASQTPGICQVLTSEYSPVITDAVTCTDSTENQPEISPDHNAPFSGRYRGTLYNNFLIHRVWSTSQNKLQPSHHELPPASVQRSSREQTPCPSEHPETVTEISSRSSKMAGLSLSEDSGSPTKTYAYSPSQLSSSLSTPVACWPRASFPESSSKEESISTPLDKATTPGAQRFSPSMLRLKSVPQGVVEISDQSGLAVCRQQAHVNDVSDFEVPPGASKAPSNGVGHKAVPHAMNLPDELKAVVTNPGEPNSNSMAAEAASLRILMSELDEEDQAFLLSLRD